MYLKTVISFIYKVPNVYYLLHKSLKINIKINEIFYKQNFVIKRTLLRSEKVTLNILLEYQQCEKVNI